MIPYTEIFTALQESGLALDVLKFSLTDDETRQGIIELVLELVPLLVGICAGESEPFVVRNSTSITF